MSGVFATPRVGAGPRWVAGSQAHVRGGQLASFVALTSLIALAWGRLVDAAPVGKIALAIALATALAAAAQLAIGSERRRTARLAPVLAAALAALAGLIVIGIPLSQMLPSGWSELSSHVRTGIGELGGATYPYVGSDGWARTVALIPIPLFAGALIALSFWQGRRGEQMRAVALAIGIAGFAVPTIMNSRGAGAIDGAALFCVVCAWVWLPGLRGSAGRLAAALVAAVAVGSIGVVGALGRDTPIVDYKDWNPFSNIADLSESFRWDQTYGPIYWERDGTKLLHVQSHGPHYWRTIVLDRFDGFGWSSSLSPARPGSELPIETTARAASANLNPDWVSRFRFSVDDLDSDSVVGAGTILSVGGLGDVDLEGTRAALPGDSPLAPGDSYTVKSYVPDPSPDQMRFASDHFPAAVADYRRLLLPQAQPGDQGNGLRFSRGLGSQSDATFAALDVPAYRPQRKPSPELSNAIAASPYARTFALARHLTARSRTEYGAVEAIENHLRHNYTYDESPPARDVPLSAFLFKDKIGYCQQFSGSMALMLRMLGIPARVASGFAPGENTDNSQYAITDLDAHAWVEVYFTGIGWVTFDPTPGVVADKSAAGGAGPAVNVARSGPRELEGSDTGVGPIPKQALGQDDSSGVPTALIGLLASLAAIALLVAGAIALRTRRYESADPHVAADAQLREFELALVRLGYRVPPGSTLLMLQRQLEGRSRPATGAYITAMREHRYGVGSPSAPALAERKRVRRELASGRGLRRRLEALRAMPPGAPSVPWKLREGKLRQRGRAVA